jgi:hypothetical protein
MVRSGLSQSLVSTVLSGDYVVDERAVAGAIIDWSLARGVGTAISGVLVPSKRKRSVRAQQDNPPAFGRLA